MITNYINTLFLALWTLFLFAWAGIWKKHKYFLILDIVIIIICLIKIITGVCSIC